MSKGAPLLALLALACVSVGKSVLDTSFQTNPVERDNVFVYVEGDSIPEHTRIAILDARGDSDMTDEGDLLNKMREEAGKLGANATSGATRTSRVRGHVLQMRSWGRALIGRPRPSLFLSRRGPGMTTDSRIEHIP